MDTYDQKYTPELQIGERIIWHGQPKQGFIFKPADYFPFLLLAIFFGLGILMGKPSAGFSGLANSPSPLLLFSFPLSLPVIALLILLVVLPMQIRKSTEYFITNQRVITYKSWITTKIETVEVNTLNELVVYRNQDGSGSIFFGRSSPLAWANPVFPFDYPGRAYKAPGFEDILDLDAVLKHLQKLNDRFTTYEPVPSEG
jgi:hypothetical protein